MKIAIYYSSLTGNTEKLAKYISSQIGENVYVADMKNVDEIIPADMYIIAFWCRRSSMDDLSSQFLKKLKNKNILAIGTIGGDAYGAYGQRVKDNVKKQVSEHAELLDVCICQGSIDLKRSEKRFHLPASNPHHINEAKYQRHLRTQGHPDLEDLNRVWTNILSYIQ